MSPASDLASEPELPIDDRVPGASTSTRPPGMSSPRNDYILSSDYFQPGHDYVFYVGIFEWTVDIDLNVLEENPHLRPPGTFGLGVYRSREAADRRAQQYYTQHKAEILSIKDFFSEQVELRQDKGSFWTLQYQSRAQDDGHVFAFQVSVTKVRMHEPDERDSDNDVTEEAKAQELAVLEAEDRDDDV